MSIMNAIEKSKATESKATEGKATESKATLNREGYKYLTQVQKFDALARLARTAQKFVKPELLGAVYGTNQDWIELFWVIEQKGLPVMNLETLEIEEAKPFAIHCSVLIKMSDMSDIMVECKMIEPSEDKVQVALTKRLQRDLYQAMIETDLSPLTRTRKSSSDSEEQ